MIALLCNANWSFAILSIVANSQTNSLRYIQISITTTAPVDVNRAAVQ